MKTLIVSAAKAGHVNQCIAFCEHARWEVDEIVRIPAPGPVTPLAERIKLRAAQVRDTLRALPWSRAPGQLRIVASARAAERVVAAYRTLYGSDLFAVFAGRPRWRSEIYDLALVPSHEVAARSEPDDYASPAAAITLLRRGVLARDAPVSAEPGQGVFVMIGGVNKAFEIEPTAIARQIRQFLDREATLPMNVAFSRRTPAAVEAKLRASLENTPVNFVERTDRGGFERALAGAATYLVTPGFPYDDL